MKPPLILLIILSQILVMLDIIWKVILIAINFIRYLTFLPLILIYHCCWKASKLKVTKGPTFKDILTNPENRVKGRFD